LNQFDSALEEGRAAVKLAPTSVVAYQQLARALIALDRLPEAKDVIKEAASKGLDSSPLRQLQFDLAFVDRDTGAMQEQLRAAASRQDGYLVATEAARAAAARGDVDTSQTLYAQVIAAARTSRNNDFVGRLIAEQALNDALVGNVDRARAGLQSAIAVSHGPETTWTASLAAAFSGQTARASELARAFQGLEPPAPDVVNAQLPMLQAAIALSGNDSSAALSALNSAAPFEAIAGPWLPYLRGLAYAAAGGHGEAARQFGNILAHPANQATSFVHTLARLQLARAARDAGNNADARKAYADFSAAMTGASPRHPLLAAAAREAAALPASAPSPP
jgi:predicted Zn-dependent protease